MEHDLLDKAGTSTAGMQVKDFDHAWRVLQPQVISHARTPHGRNKGPRQNLPPLRHAKKLRHLVDRMPACRRLSLSVLWKLAEPGPNMNQLIPRACAFTSRWLNAQIKPQQCSTTMRTKPHPLQPPSLERRVAFDSCCGSSQRSKA